MPYPLQDVDLWLVDSLVVPVSLHGLDGRFVHVNAAAERASGYSNDQLLGRHFTDLLRPEARENVASHFRRAVEFGEPADFVTVFVDAGGHLRGVRAQHLPLRHDDSIVGVLILAFDVRLPPPEFIRLKPEPRVTPRQRQILALVASGLSTAEVASELTVSPETVRNHLRNAFRELGAHTRVEAIAAAQRLGLLASPVLGPQPADSEEHRQGGQ
jgi:PAS domain S-box-containing protein